jgi:hypothetical protein
LPIGAYSDIIKRDAGKGGTRGVYRHLRGLIKIEETADSGENIEA